MHDRRGGGRGAKSALWFSTAAPSCYAMGAHAPLWCQVHTPQCAARRRLLAAKPTQVPPSMAAGAPKRARGSMPGRQPTPAALCWVLPVRLPWLSIYVVVASGITAKPL